MTIDIRAARESDIDVLAVLGAFTFTRSFAHLYAPEDLDSFIREKHSPDYYRAALCDPDIGLLVADDSGQLAAYSKYGPNTLPCDPPRPTALELSRIYVDPDYQSRGLGEMVLLAVERAARAQGYPEIVLSVFSENPGAIKFYQKHGFDKIGDNFFQVGNHKDHDYIFAKQLGT